MFLIMLLLCSVGKSFKHIEGSRSVGFSLFGKKKYAPTAAKGVICSGGSRGSRGSGGGDGWTYTENQKQYINALNNPDIGIVVVIGSAGTGKTVIGCNYGLNELIEGNYKRVIITRPLVPVSGEEIGFIPGGVVSKMMPWTRPIYDAFLEKGIINKPTLDKYIAEETIEVIPLAFMRGRTFTNSFIFADEMQNSTPEQMLMLLTRIGNGSKLVISGDLAQSDIGRGCISGLFDFVKKIKMYDASRGGVGSVGAGVVDDWHGDVGDWDVIVGGGVGEGGGGGCGGGCDIKIIEFERSDICRSNIITRVLKIYDL